MRRWLSVLFALAIISVMASPASAAEIKRTWSAAMGTSAINGRIYLQGMVDGSGLLSLNLKSLGANRQFSIQVRQGKCTALGRVIATAPAATSAANGTLVTSHPFSQAEMNLVWYYGQRGSMAVRIVNRAKTVCGNFTFARSTRIQIPALGINLAVIPGASTYPKCNVAMYMVTAWQPREPSTTFIYAHARKGMFLPLLTRSMINDGASMIGMTVRVWTSDNKLHTYVVDKVRRHVSVLTAEDVSGLSERLLLQTSEGPNFRYPKLILEAHRVSTAAATRAASQPVARPVSC